jgi:hypothetical protein
MAVSAAALAGNNPPSRASKKSGALSAISHLEVVPAEGGEVNEIVPGRLKELLLASKLVNTTGAGVAWLAETDHKHFVLRYPLPVQVDNVVELLARATADAVFIRPCQMVPVSFDGGSGHN